MASESEVIEEIKRAHQRGIGFGASLGKRAATVRSIGKGEYEASGPGAHEALLDAIDHDLARQRKRRPVRKSEPVDLLREWRGGDDGMTLRKCAPEPTVPGDDGAAFALVKMTHAVGGRAEGGAPARPSGAIADARKRASDLARAGAAGVEIADGRRQEAADLASALGLLPAPRRTMSDYGGGQPVGGAVQQHYSPLSSPETPVPATWQPHAGHVAASEGAAQVAGGDVDEQLAAIRSGDHAWLEKIRERGTLAEIKRLRGVRCGAAPPRFRPS
jgi:hypothetical protein